MTINLNELAPFMLADKTQEELKAIHAAAYSAVMAGVDKHAGLLLHYSREMIEG